MLQRKHTPFYNQSQEIRLFLSTEPSITSSLLAAASSSSSFYFRKKDLLTKEKKLQDDEANHTHTHTHTKVYLKQFGTHLENLTFS